jgi:hypothetical protein
MLHHTNLLISSGGSHINLAILPCRKLLVWSKQRWDNLADIIGLEVDLAVEPYIIIFCPSLPLSSFRSQMSSHGTRKNWTCEYRG